MTRRSTSARWTAEHIAGGPAVSAYCENDARDYSLLTLRRGVSLIGLGRNPADVHVFFKTLLHCMTQGGKTTSFSAEEFEVRVEFFLTHYGAWLKESPGSVADALIAYGLAAQKKGTVTVTVAATDEWPEEKLAAFWQRLEGERNERRALARARLQEKNRAANAPKLPDVDPEFDERMMRIALEMAKEAFDHDEVPVGAVLVLEGNIVSRTCNAVIGLRDATAHAEILAIRKACATLGNERLTGTTLYVTLEPCAMCAAAIAHARIARVVWAAHDPRCGGMGGAVDVASAAGMNHRAVTDSGILATESTKLINRFFAKKRKKDTQEK